MTQCEQLYIQSHNTTRTIDSNIFEHVKSEERLIKISAGLLHTSNHYATVKVKQIDPEFVAVLPSSEDLLKDAEKLNFHIQAVKQRLADTLQRESYPVIRHALIDSAIRVSIAAAATYFFCIIIDKSKYNLQIQQRSNPAAFTLLLATLVIVLALLTISFIACAFLYLYSKENPRDLEFTIKKLSEQKKRIDTLIEKSKDLKETKKNLNAGSLAIFKNTALKQNLDEETKLRLAARLYLDQPKPKK